jgi:hypothetical protein
MARSVNERQQMETAAFFNALAHKLRTRLGVIQTAIYNIKQKASNPEINSSISKIERKVLESSQIISSLLAFTQIKPPSYGNAAPAPNWDIRTNSKATSKSDRMKILYPVP